jgi:hypothetical protein
MAKNEKAAHGEMNRPFTNGKGKSFGGIIMLESFNSEMYIYMLRCGMSSFFKQLGTDIENCKVKTARYMSMGYSFCEIIFA